MNSNKELLDSGYTRFSAPAKLNLFLKVINKRKDGYHNIQSVFQLIDLQDDIFIKLRNKDNQITIKNSSLLIKPEHDLAFKAAELMLIDRQLGADIIINKEIPAEILYEDDMAITFFVLDTIGDIGKFNLSKINLMKNGLKLGADIPFFINGVNAWVEGVGELLYDIKITNSTYVVMVPNLSINTKTIFEGFKLTNSLIPLKIASSYNAVKHDFVRNDLEETVIKKYVKMAELLKWMRSYKICKNNRSITKFFKN